MEFAEGTFQGLHPDEVELFRRILKGVKGIGVEIGCCDGYSSAIILDASELHLTSIDPFIPDSMEPSLVGSKEKYLANVRAFGDRSYLIEGYSFSVAGHRRLEESTGPLRPMDFLFIDGDHNHEWCLRDFTDWAPCIRTGGILAMHDARMGREGGANFHPGPSRVAQDHIFAKPDEWQIIGEAFSLVIARKR